MIEYSIILTNEALDDLFQIYFYIANYLLDKVVAKREVSKIKEKIETLRYFPLKYPIHKFKQFKNIKTRFMAIDNYIVIYFVKKEIINILRIVYCKRDI